MLRCSHTKDTDIETRPVSRRAQRIPVGISLTLLVQSAKEIGRRYRPDSSRVCRLESCYEMSLSRPDQEPDKTTNHTGLIRWHSPSRLDESLVPQSLQSGTDHRTLETLQSRCHVQSKLILFAVRNRIACKALKPRNRGSALCCQTFNASRFDIIAAYVCPPPVPSEHCTYLTGLCHCERIHH